MLLLARTKQLNKASRWPSRRKAVQSRGAGLEHLITRKREIKRLCEAALHGILEEPLQMTLVYQMLSKPRSRETEDEREGGSLSP